MAGGGKKLLMTVNRSYKSANNHSGVKISLMCFKKAAFFAMMLGKGIMLGKKYALGCPGM